MEERGGEVDHATLQRGVVQDSPPLAEACHRRTQPVWVSWRRDATYIKIKGHLRHSHGGQAMGRLRLSGQTSTAMGPFHDHWKVIA